MSKVSLLGVGIDDLSLQEVITHIIDRVRLNQRAIVGYVNVHALNLAYEIPWFKRFLNQADIAFCDGMGVQIGARLVNKRIAKRFALTDWLPELAARAAQEEISMYFLGNPPRVAEKASQVLREQYPALRIAGTHHGYFDKAFSSPENQAVVAAINASQADILVVAFGMPLQERWLQENWEQLDVGVAITGGAVFEYISGTLKRGPKWMTDHYLEWLARIIISPRRYYSRYGRDIPLFLWRLLQEKWR